MTDMTTEEFQKLQQTLPNYFTMFSYESLCEMALNQDHGYTTPHLRDDLVEEFRKSPRAFMIKLLEQERDKAIEALRLLGITCYKCNKLIQEGSNMCKECFDRKYFASCGSG